MPTFQVTSVISLAIGTQKQMHEISRFLTRHRGATTVRQYSMADFSLPDSHDAPRDAPHVCGSAHLTCF
jgi:hypothetical protein